MNLPYYAFWNRKTDIIQTPILVSLQRPYKAWLPSLQAWLLIMNPLTCQQPANGEKLFTDRSIADKYEGKVHVVAILFSSLQANNIQI